MATPTSDCARTGASFIPSPTNTRVLPLSSFFRYSCIHFTLSSGRHFACTSSSCNVSLTALATSWLSPVSIAAVETPASRNKRMASGASAFNVSAIRMYPAYRPSTARCTAVPISVGAFVCSPASSRYFAFPARTCLPSIFAETPCPASSCTSVTRAVSGSFP